MTDQRLAHLGVKLSFILEQEPCHTYCYFLLFTHFFWWFPFLTILECIFFVISVSDYFRACAYRAYSVAYGTCRGPVQEIWCHNSSKV